MSRAFVNQDDALVEVVPVGTPEDPTTFAARLEARLASREQTDQPFHQ